MLNAQHLVLFSLLSSTFAFVRGKRVLSATDISASFDERRAYGLYGDVVSFIITAHTADRKGKLLGTQP